MRIAMVGDEFYPDVGGAPVYTMELAKALANLGVKPTVLTHAHPGLPEEGEFGGVKVKRLKGFVMPRLNRALSAGLARRLHRCIKFDGYDVVHGQDLYSPMALQSVYSARRCGIPPVLTCHSIHETSSFWRLVYRPLVFTMERADRVVAVCDATKKFCRALGVPDHKIVVIPNGTDPSGNLAIDRPSARARIGIKQEPLVVTAIRLVKRKGPEHLVVAFSKIVKALPDAKLMIAGRGPEAENLQILVKKLGIQNSVFMLGFLPHEKVMELIAAADVFVLPSIVEACPIALLEAMAAGAPTVCTRVGGIPEIVKDGVNGLMVQPGDEGALADAILHILNDDKLAERIRANGLKIVREGLSWERTAERTLAVYETVREEHARGRAHY